VRVADEFDGDVGERAICELVDTITVASERRAELVALLDERHPVHAGRGANEVIGIRGYVVAAFATTGLPDAALYFVVEEHGSAIGGGMGEVPGANRLPVDAVGTVRQVDYAVYFQGFHPVWPAADRTTATDVPLDVVFADPTRPELYGRDRGVVFGPDDRFFRVRGDVGLGPVVVNRHRIELFVLDADGRIATEFIRRRWAVEDVLSSVSTSSLGTVPGGRRP
jgi:hypothetical protein